MNNLTRLRIEADAPVARIILSNPPLNVIDMVMMDELARVLSEIEAQPEISMVIFEGEGECFSAGVDVAAHTPEAVPSMLEKFHKVIRELISTHKVTIASVRGHCLGGGAELAMMCDLVYTSNDAQWSFPEIQLGCFPPVAATALSVLVGQKRAADLILTGRMVSGAEAVEIGLANRAVQANELSSAVAETTSLLSKMSSCALGLAKRALYAWDSVHFDKGLSRAEKIYIAEVMKTEDAVEGIQAFTEKRAPKWKGH